jgi:hypothetical protein
MTSVPQSAMRCFAILLSDRDDESVSRSAALTCIKKLEGAPEPVISFKG